VKGRDNTQEDGYHANNSKGTCHRISLGTRKGAKRLTSFRRFSTEGEIQKEEFLETQNVT